MGDSKEFYTKFRKHPLTQWVSKTILAMDTIWKQADDYCQKETNTMSQKRLAAALMQKWMAKTHVFKYLKCHTQLEDMANTTATKRVKQTTGMRTVKNGRFVSPKPEMEPADADLSQEAFDNIYEAFLLTYRSQIESLDSVSAENKR